MPGGSVVALHVQSNPGEPSCLLRAEASCVS
jgi:hypothetical protein